MACSAVYCTSKKKCSPDVSFFSFPKDKLMRLKWVVAMRRESLTKRYELWEPSTYSRLCSQHFTPEDIDPTSPFRKKLKSDAVPSIFAWTDKDKVKKTRPIKIRQPLPARRKVNEEEAPNEVLQEINGPLHELPNPRTDSEKELIEKLKTKEEQLKKKDEILRIRQEELKKKHEELVMREEALKLKDLEIEKLKKCLDKKSDVISRQKKELKRVRASENYYKIKLLPMMETLVEELVETEIVTVDPESMEL